MGVLLAAVLTLFLTGAARAQDDRVALFVDGRTDELVTVHGKGRWVQDPARVRTGVAALRIEPVAPEKFPGFSVSNVPSRGAKALVLGVFLEGPAPKSYRIRLDDDQSNNATDDVAIEYRTIEPGWNDVVVPLEGRTTVKGRPMTFTSIVRRLQFTKKLEASDPAVVVDAVILRGPAAPPSRQSFATQLAAEQEVSRRVALLKELAALEDQDVATTALDLLAREEQPRVRRAARAALSRISTPAAALSVADACWRLPQQPRTEALWAVASMPCREARQRAIGWVRDSKGSKATAADRTALLTGLALAGGSDVGGLVDVVPPQAPWPVRAQLVNAIRAVAEPESVDALIAILAEPGSARVAHDAEVALGVLTGGDYGTEAATWRDWWRVNRDRTQLRTKAATRAGSYGKATFYGLGVPEGRVAFVVDTSGSMGEAVGGKKLLEYIKSAGHLSDTAIRTRLDLAVAELAHAVSNMKDRSSVAVISFSSEDLWQTKGFETVTPDLRAKIGERVHRLSAGGSTNVYAGLHAAFHPTGKPRPQDVTEGPDTIFLLTDGNPSSGRLTEFDDLRDEVLAWNLGRAIRIHCVNVGDTNARLLRGLAYGTGGTVVDLKTDRTDDEERNK
jgi:hypothetical protein